MVLDTQEGKLTYKSTRKNINHQPQSQSQSHSQATGSIWPSLYSNNNATALTKWNQSKDNQSLYQPGHEPRQQGVAAVQPHWKNFYPDTSQKNPVDYPLKHTEQYLAITTSTCKNPFRFDTSICNPVKQEEVEEKIKVKEETKSNSNPSLQY